MDGEEEAEEEIEDEVEGEAAPVLPVVEEEIDEFELVVYEPSHPPHERGPQQRVVIGNDPQNIKNI